MELVCPVINPAENDTSLFVLRTYCLTPGYEWFVSIILFLCTVITGTPSEPHQISDVPSDLLVDTLLLWGMRTLHIIVLYGEKVITRNSERFPKCRIAYLPEVAGMFRGLEVDRDVLSVSAVLCVLSRQCQEWTTTMSFQRDRISRSSRPSRLRLARSLRPTISAGLRPSDSELKQHATKSSSSASDIGKQSRPIL